MSRADDLESLLYVLLEFYHGALPWADAPPPPSPAKVQRMAAMKADPAVMADILSRSPQEFAAFRAHCASLPFGTTPDYALLRGLFRARMRREGWGWGWGGLGDGPQGSQPEGVGEGNGGEVDFDWVDSKALPRGTLLPEEYFVHMDFVEEPYWDPNTM